MYLCVSHHHISFLVLPNLRQVVMITFYSVPTGVRNCALFFPATRNGDAMSHAVSETGTSPFNCDFGDHCTVKFAQFRSTSFGQGQQQSTLDTTAAIASSLINLKYWRVRFVPPFMQPLKYKIVTLLCCCVLFNNSTRTGPTVTEQQHAHAYAIGNRYGQKVTQAAHALKQTFMQVLIDVRLIYYFAHLVWAGDMHGLRFAALW